MPTTTDASETSVAVKVCCACGTIVNGKKRMKDHQGQYWCIPCGKADSEKKQQSIAKVAACGGCYKPFPTKKLKEYGSMSYCPACYRKVHKSEGGGGMLAAIPMDDPKVRMGVMIGGGVVALLLIYLVIHFLL